MARKKPTIDAPGLFPGTEATVPAVGATTAPGVCDSPEACLALVRGAKCLGIDCETWGLQPAVGKLRLVSVSDGNRHLVWDCFQHDPKPLLDALRGKMLVAHNGFFDYGWLWAYGLTCADYEPICTMLMSRLLTAGSGQGNSLADVCARVGGPELDKTHQVSDWSKPLTQAQVEYARMDARVLLPIFKRLTEQIEAAGLDTVCALEMRALPAFVWMARAGVPFDAAAWVQLAQTADTEARRLLDEMHILIEQAQPGLLKREFNLDSPAQVLQAFELLGIHLGNTNDEHLAACNHPLAALMRDYREHTTLLKMYGTDQLKFVHTDGRLYPGWNQLGTRTGRTSCAGPNCQQLPRKTDKDGNAVYRKCFVAPPGKVLVKCDFGQYQLRIAAKYSKDARMLEAYRSDKSDLHSMTAQFILGKQEITKADRQIAKSLNFGLVFGMSWRGLLRYAKTTYGVELTEQKAEEYHRRYFETYPGLRAWHNRIRQEHCMETRSASGRRRLLDAKTPDTERANSPVQGDEADGSKLAMALLWERRGQVGADTFPVLFVHDESVVETPEKEAKATEEWIRQAMIDGAQEFLGDVPIVVESKICKTWGG